MERIKKEGGRMFKKIKKYFRLKKRMRIEVLETLASICLYLDYESRLSRNANGVFMRGHFNELKAISEALRNESDTYD